MPRNNWKPDLKVKKDFEVRKMGFQEGKAGFGKGKTSIQEGKTDFQEDMMGFQESKPGFQERKLGFQERKPGFQEMKPSFQERKLGFKKVQWLDDPTYEELKTMTRCLHMDDVEQTFQRRMLVPQRIRNSNAANSIRNVMVSAAEVYEKHYVWN